MMRSVRFTIWQMLLVVVLVVGVASAVLAALERFIPGLEFPWLMPLLAFVAADAVVTQRVVTRERLSFAEQGGLRMAELVVLLVAVRLASLSSEELPLLQTATSWIRDPLAFFGGTFSMYLLPSFLMWCGATVLAQSVLHFEAELPGEGWIGIPSEEALVIEERAQAVARFDRYWLFCTLLSLACATLALYGVSLVRALQHWDTARPVLAVLGVLLAGLQLHSQGQFDRLTYGWQLGQVVVTPDVSYRTRAASRWLSIGALLLGLALGSVALLIPPPPIVPVLNALLLASTVLLALVVGLMSLLLLPFAWLLSLLTGSPAPVPPAVPQLPVMQIPETTPERPLLPALIFWLCAVMLVGIAALRYAQQRRDLRALVARWPRLHWILARIYGVWREAQEWTAYATLVIRQNVRRRTASRRAPYPPLTGTRAQLRELYYRLIRAAERGGVDHTASQTPYEFRTAVGDKLPAVRADVAVVTDLYVAAEYGPAMPEEVEVRRARRAWRRALQVIVRAHKKVVAHDGGRKR